MYLASALLFLTSAFSSFVAALPSQLPLDAKLGHRVEDSKVNVSLYVMSRCRDARLCEDLFEDVFKTDDILQKVNLNMNYIGSINKAEPLGVSCKHGPLECLGNAHQLCAYHHLPLDQFWAFVQCQNFPSSYPKDIGDPSFDRQCIETIGEQWWESGVGECIEGKLQHNDTASSSFNGDGDREEESVGLGKEGRRLLRKNIRHTEGSGVTKSCTIEIESTLVSAGKRTCEVDAGVWRGCDDGHTAADLARVIEAEWQNLKSKENAEHAFRH
ncbi:hypothetical protein IAR55_001266 [Kwoniella newhampshirensis]|uniref:Uncharacterized protein n=1 Tax=Kwoniella newhampshirensis TaxID=1651941 RepID=A0AAW0Z581_9TREE